MNVMAFAAVTISYFPLQVRTPKCRPIGEKNSTRARTHAVSAHVSKSALCLLPWNLLNQYALLGNQRAEKLPGVLLVNSGRACGFKELSLLNR